MMIHLETAAALMATYGDMLEGKLDNWTDELQQSRVNQVQEFINEHIDVIAHMERMIYNDLNK